MRGRAYIKQLMREAGLAVREDTMGSIYGVLPGADPAAPAVGTGSHADAIPLAGAYDGTLGALRCAGLGGLRATARACRRLVTRHACRPERCRRRARPLACLPPCRAGVIGGIAALRALRDAGFVPARPLEVVMFTSEEPTRFGLSCSGSRAMAGAPGRRGGARGGATLRPCSSCPSSKPRLASHLMCSPGLPFLLVPPTGVLDAAYLDSLRDENGTTYLAAATAAGYGPPPGSGGGTAEMLAGARRTRADLAAFLELHIEQARGACQGCLLLLWGWLEGHVLSRGARRSACICLPGCPKQKGLHLLPQLPPA